MLWRLPHLPAGYLLHRQRRRPQGLAQRLTKETTMSLKWIAGQLAMGSWTHISNLLVAERKRGFKKN